MKTIVLAGIPGSGKTSLLKEVKQLSNVIIVNYGDKMLEEAASENLSRDALRKMSFKEQQEIGIRAAKKIIQKNTEKVMIIDTHALIRTNIAYCPGLPLAVLQILSPAAYVLIECHPQNILARRSKDLDRTRDGETEKELLIHQELTRSFLTACSMQTGSLLCYIENNNQSIRQNALPLIHLIQSIEASQA